MTDIPAILDRLSRLFPKAIDLSLDRIRALLHRLGDPQDRLAPVIHVAGTNGKGSTVAMLRACLEAAGYRTHVYTSPHLVRFNERIRLAGRLVDDALLSDLLGEVERVNDGAPITFFEITTAAAYLAFARVPADVVLLETGLGGRLDTTNLIAAPAVTAITPVS
ncbi:MAG: bifunctional folylpolyglutamate synthase/dihydrofolate synthase, partial [Aliidongia sp.]